MIARFFRSLRQRAPKPASWRNLALFTAAMVVTGHLAFKALPEQPLPHTVREKMEHWRQYGNDYDAVFLGSSRIQNHIIPKQFDPLVSGRGGRFRSFNFGISSMHTPEDTYLLDLILAQSHRRLKWVFIEIDFFDLPVQKDEAGTARGVYWQDWPRMAAIFHRLFGETNLWTFRGMRNVRNESGTLFDHSMLFLQRSFCLGQGSDLLRRWLFHIPRETMDAKALGEWGDGWLPALAPNADSETTHANSLRSLLAERVKIPPRKDEAGQGSQDDLAVTLEKVEAAGAMPVLIIPPRTRQYYFYPQRALADRYPIVDTCDPIRYPELYQYDLRIDGSHLNRSGAEIFTRIVAARFLEIWKARLSSTLGTRRTSG